MHREASSVSLDRGHCMTGVFWCVPAPSRPLVTKPAATGRLTDEFPDPCGVGGWVLAQPAGHNAAKRLWIDVILVILAGRAALMAVIQQLPG